MSGGHERTDSREDLLAVGNPRVNSYERLDDGGPRGGAGNEFAAGVRRPLVGGYQWHVREGPRAIIPITPSTA